MRRLKLKDLHEGDLFRWVEPDGRVSRWLGLLVGDPNQRDSFFMCAQTSHWLAIDAHYRENPVMLVSRSE